RILEDGEVFHADALAELVEPGAAGEDSDHPQCTEDGWVVQDLDRCSEHTLAESLRPLRAGNSAACNERVVHESVRRAGFSPKGVELTRLELFDPVESS